MMPEYFISSKKPDVLNFVSLNVNVNPVQTAQSIPAKAIQAYSRPPGGGGGICVNS